MLREPEKKASDVFDALKGKNNTRELIGHLEDLGNTFIDMSFQSHFNRYLENYDGNLQDLSRLTSIDKDYIYQITNGRRRPDRERAIALCLAIGMSEEECSRCLERSNLAILYPKSKRDSVIIYAFNNKLTVDELNRKLVDLGFHQLIVSKSQKTQFPHN